MAAGLVSYSDAIDRLADEEPSSDRLDQVLALARRFERSTGQVLVDLHRAKRARRRSVTS